jgi:uracil-DNA glycosylase
MALHESALEEFGLAPLWVRRGMEQVQPVERVDPAVEDAVQRAAPAAPAARSREESFEPRARVAAAQPASGSSNRGEGQQHRITRSDEAPQADADMLRVSAPIANASDSRTAPEANAVPSTPASSPAPALDDDFAWFDDLPSHPPGQTQPARAARAEPSVQTLDWDALSERVAACELCRLCEKRTNPVFGVGDRNADWMLIGEAPGENEDRQGEPFVGQAGKLLDNMLRSLTLARDTNVYIANVIKCRPPGNRNPEPDEVARCEPYLQRQVALVKPKLIVAMGRFAAQSLLKTDASISSLRGRVHVYEGVPVIVTYHPAYLLRSLPDKAKAWSDLCLARDLWLKAAGAPAR